MIEFIEFTEENGKKLAINRETIVAFGHGESEKGEKGIGINTKDGTGWFVTESYEQVKHLIETGEPLDIAENKTIDTQQGIEWFKQFENAQREQIMLGLGSDVDVSLYAKLDFNSDQMRQIRIGQEKDVDVLLYARKEFNWQQMRQIRWGLQSGIDVILYLDPNITWEEMEKIRKKLEKEKQEQDSKKANEPLDDGKLYRIKLGDYYIGLSKPDNKIHMGYNSEDNKYYQRIFTLPQIYKLDPRLLPLAVEVTT